MTHPGPTAHAQGRSLPCMPSEQEVDGRAPARTHAPRHLAGNPQPRSPDAHLRHPQPMGALALAVAGVLFVLYPAVRPWQDESTVEGAIKAMSSGAWVAAHLFLAQFFTPPAVRIAHGVLVAAGSIWVALALWRASEAQAP